MLPLLLLLVTQATLTPAARSGGMPFVVFSVDGEDDDRDRERDDQDEYFDEEDEEPADEYGRGASGYGSGSDVDRSAALNDSYDDQQRRSLPSGFRISDEEGAAIGELLKRDGRRVRAALRVFPGIQHMANAFVRLNVAYQQQGQELAAAKCVLAAAKGAAPAPTRPSESKRGGAAAASSSSWDYVDEQQQQQDEDEAEEESGRARSLDETGDSYFEEVNDEDEGDQDEAEAEEDPAAELKAAAAASGAPLAVSPSELGLSLEDMLRGPLEKYRPAFRAAGFGDVDFVIALSDDQQLHMLILVDREIARLRIGEEMPLPEKALFLQLLRLTREKIGELW